MLLYAPSALQTRSSFPRTKSPNGFPQRSHGTALGARFYPTLTPRTCLNRATSAW